MNRTEQIAQTPATRTGTLVVLANLLPFKATGALAATSWFRTALPVAALAALLLFTTSANAAQTHLFQFALDGTTLPPKASATADLNAATGTANVEEHSNILTGVDTSSGPFTVGMSIFGSGIPEGTVIIETPDATEIRISNTAVADGTGVGITAGSITNLTATTGVIGESQTIVGSGLPAGTRILSEQGGLLFLSKPVATAGTAVPISGYILKPEAIAVDASSGDLYVAEGKVVDRLDPDGDFLSQIDGSETVQGSFGGPRSVAVDPATGDLYVADGGSVVDKFDAVGKLEKTFGQEGQLGGAGTPEGGALLSTAIAVDPQTGDLYVSNQSTDMIDVFTSGGRYLRQFTTGLPIRGIAIDSQGDLFAATYGGGVSSPVDVYVASTGALNPAYGGGTGVLYSAPTVGGVTVDPATDDVYIAAAGTVTEFDKAGAFVSTFGSGHLVEADAIAIGDAASHIYVDDTGSSDNEFGPQMAVFDRSPVPLPGAATAEATDLAATSATLNGSVDPSGIAVTECLFEYGKTESYGSTAPCVPAAAALGEGTEAVAVHADVSGLEPGQAYHYRLSAGNENGTTAGSDRIFGEPPHVDATTVTAISSSAATLQAQIDPGDVAATYHFEYSTDPGFAGALRVPVPDGGIGAARADQAVSQPVAGLLPETTYYYHVVAANAAAPAGVTGPTKALHTHSTSVDTTLPDHRSYELVSPGTKTNGGGVYDFHQTFLSQGNMPAIQAEEDGSAITYGGDNFYAPSNSVSANGYTSVRGVDGWTTRNTTGESPEEAFAPLSPPPVPPTPTLPPSATPAARFVEQTPDGAIVFFTDTGKLTGDSTAAAGEPDLYRYDLETEAITDLTVDPNAGEHADVQGVLGAGGEGSEAGSYVYFVADGALSGEASRGDCEPQGGFTAPGDTHCNLYLSHDGSVTFIASLSSQDNEHYGGQERVYVEVRDWSTAIGVRTAEVSPNGRYLAFGAQEELTNQAADGPQIFRYAAESTDQLICASCNADGSTSPAAFLLFPAAAGGLRQHYMVDDGRLLFNDFGPLVSTDVNNAIDVYEFEDQGTGTCQIIDGCRSLISGGVGGGDSLLAAVSAEGTDVFFTSFFRLTSEDHDGAADMYDARIDGREPLAPKIPCETGESCRPNPPPPPVEQSPGTVGFHEPPPPVEKPCRKGFVRRGSRCFKKPLGHHAHRKHHKKHRSRRGAG